MSCWEEENCCFDPEDLLYEQYLEEQAEKERRNQAKLEEHRLIIHISRQAYPNNPIWIGADGQRYNIEDMSTSHIKNCLKLIYKNNGNWRQNFIRPFECELRKRKYAETL